MIIGLQGKIIRGIGAKGERNKSKFDEVYKMYSEKNSAYIRTTISNIDKMSFIVVDKDGEEYKQYNREIDQYIEEYYKQHKNAEVDAYRNTDKWK